VRGEAAGRLLQALLMYGMPAATLLAFDNAWCGNHSSLGSDSMMDERQRSRIREPAPGAVFKESATSWFGGDVFGPRQRLCNDVDERPFFQHTKMIIDGNKSYPGGSSRHAEPGGLAFYVNGFNAGGETPATILWSIMGGAQGTDALSVQNKVTAAMTFTRVIDPDLDGQNFQVTYAGDTDAQKARDFLATVTEDVATIPAAVQVTTWMKTTIADPGDPILGQ
jgi:hypothetical protein